jgi:hypothetical protein
MLPKNLKYQNKVEPATARQYTSVIAPQNGLGPYVMGSTVILNIPTGRNLVMVGSESYLRYRLNTKIGANTVKYIRLDGAGAHGVIQRLRSFHGGKIIEDLDNYHVLACKLLALQQSSDSSRNKLNITAGLTNAMCCNGTTGECYDNAVGDRLAPAFHATTELAANATIKLGGTVEAPNYCIPLISLFGSLSNQYIPLFAMTAGPIRIELQLISDMLKMLNSEYVLSTTASDHYIDNVEFVAQYIELSDSAIDTIIQSLQGQPLQFVAPQYRNYIDTKALANATTQVTCAVPAKFSSLKSLFCVMRDKADGAVTFFSQSSPHFNVSEYRVRIGGDLLPAKAPATMPDFFMELVKAIGSISDANHEPTISNFRYSTDSISVASGETTQLVDNTVKCNQFMLGFDCEIYANADRDSIFSGMNTVNKDIYWQITHTANASAPTVRYDFYAMYDAVYVCENGNMDVKY